MLGGLCYALGAVFNQTAWPILWPGVIQAHELFHLFVIAGVGFHWYFFWSLAEQPMTGEAAARY